MTDHRTSRAESYTPTVLLIGDAARTRPLRRALESRAAFRVVLRNGPAPGDSQFDAVVLYLDHAADAQEQLRRTREELPRAPVIAVGEGLDAAALDLDDCVTPDASPELVARCILFAMERRQLRAELESADTRFRSIIDRNMDGIVIVDREGDIGYINPAAERLFGRSAAELLGEDFGYMAVAGETTEVDLVRGGGEEAIIAELRAAATTWEGAEAQLITVRDITDRKRAEERAQHLLREQAAREQAEQASRRSRFLVEAGATLDSSLDADTTLQNLARLIVPHVGDWCIIDLLEDGHIRRVAGAHSDDTQMEVLHELRQRYPPRLDGRQPAARVIVSGRTELTLGLTADRVHELAIDDGHADLLLRLGVRSIIAVPLQAREQRIGAITFVCSERDFSPQDVALAEEIGSRAGRALENARLYEAALAANKAKADFLAVMSHELRTPLNAILGYSQLLLEDIVTELGSVERRYIERVHTSATHLLQIIEEILVFASMEAGRSRVEPVHVQLGQLVEETVGMTEPLAREKGLDFHVDVPAPRLALFTDAVKVRQIMLNLLTNAVKFTASGHVALRARQDGETLVIEVSDTGAGIDPARIHTIFEPFRQVEGPLTRHAGGTGLGLTVSQRLAMMLGGDIDVQSEVGAGSTFTVRLPVHWQRVGE